MAFKADITCMAHMMRRVPQQKEGFGEVLRLTWQCTSPSPQFLSVLTGISHLLCFT